MDVIYREKKSTEPDVAGAKVTTNVVVKLKPLSGHEHPAPTSTPKAPPNRLSHRQMESLTAVADTLLPSVDLPFDADEATRIFHLTSASMTGTPDAVGVYLSGKLQHSILWLLRLVLWLLSTWYGTLAICGLSCVSCRFPYVRRFPEIEQRRREEILLALSHSNFLHHRLLFKCLKFLVVFIYFTQVDEKNQNPAWKAIGYCGPDPDLTEQKKRIRQETILEPTKDPNTEYSDPAVRSSALHEAVIHLHRPKGAIAAALRRRGFSFSDNRIRCDVVVVGSGSGGGVVAGVLAKAGHKVVVLEKGAYNSRTDLTLLEGQAMDSMYEGNGMLSTSDIGIAVLAASTVGGGSAINWSACIRTPEHVIKEWCDDHELELFGSDTYREALDVVCERMGVQSEVGDNEGLNNEVLRRGCEELGYMVCNIPRNSPVDHNCGWCCFGCKDGKKNGTAETWLVDMAESGNGVVLPGCRVVRVLQEERKRKNGRRRRKVAKGVLFEYGGEKYAVEGKVTVVAGGALGTPVLLKRSGLRNRNIGRNLHLHPVVMVWGTFPDPPPPPAGEEEEGEKKEKPKKSYEGGIMTAMSTVASNATTTGYGTLIQTPSLHPGIFSVLTPWISSSDFRHRMTRFSHTAHIFALARDKGSGTVNRDGYLSYTIAPHDEEQLKKGTEKILRIMAAAGATEIGTQHCKGERLDVKRASSHEFERFVREASGRGLRDLSTPVCSAHQMGSCRMGVEEAESVVNVRGETWELKRLYVADSSVFPTALGVNPMVTVMATAYCIAQSVLQDLRRSGRRKPADI